MDSGVITTTVIVTPDKLYVQLPDELVGRQVEIFQMEGDLARSFPLEYVED